jgi:rare lipoprotein A
LGILAALGWVLASALSSIGCATTSDSGSLLHPQEGLARAYEAKLAGRRTASGDVYRAGAMTAAHRNLPFGTKVRVSRIGATGAVIAGPVVVRINDRGPYDTARIIELSQAAAAALDMLDGVAMVRLEVIELPARGDQRRQPPEDPQVVSNGGDAPD